MTEVFAIDIRPAQPADEAVIFSTWLKSYRYAAVPDPQVEDAIYFPFHREVILRCIEREYALVAIATPPGDSGTVLGWAVAECMSRDSENSNQTPVLHYVYVKPAFRRLGIARRLLADLGVDITKKCWITHKTKFLDQAAATARWPRLQYNPYLR